MKITALKQGIKNEESLKVALHSVEGVLRTLGLETEITEKYTTRVFTTSSFSNATVGQGTQIVPEQILAEVDGSEDIAFLFFSNESYNPKPLNPLQSPIKKGNATPCQMCEQWYNGYSTVCEDFILHEICHAMYFLLGKVSEDMTHKQGDPIWNGKFNQSTNLGYYMYLISTLIPSWKIYKKQSMATYKYFSQAEVDKYKLTPELFSTLDKMRELAGTPFIITSGLRTPEENKAVGGLPNSAHLRGLACDLACTSPENRFKILKGVTNSGIPVFIEEAGTHIHLSIDTSVDKMNTAEWRNDKN